MAIGFLLDQATGVHAKKTRTLLAATCVLVGAGGISAPTAWAVSTKDDARREQAIAEAIRAQDAAKKRREGLTEEELRREKFERERRNRIPTTEDAYDWAAVARERKLSEGHIDQLARDKLAIGTREFRQVFEIYTHPTIPVFITSDSVLNAFNSLFEDTFRELEVRRAPELRNRLEAAFAEVRTMLRHPPYAAADLAPGWLQAQRAVGPAMVLLGTSLDTFDAVVRADIQAEIARIRSADGIAMPTWLGRPSESFLGIDYRRMKPVGFYDSIAPLRDYFRAVRWLQIVPFRVDRDDEFSAIALLGYGVAQQEGGEAFFKAYQEFIGRAAPRSVTDAGRLFPRWPREATEKTWTERLAAQRKWFRPQTVSVNDSLRLSDQAEAPPFHVLATYLLPDAELFQRLVNHGERASGLYVAALLGSDFAEARLVPKDPTFVASTIKALGDAFAWAESPLDELTPVYVDYLSVLSTLFGVPDPDAPAFVGGQAWAAKSCETALGGWAQLRHTYLLQAKLTVVASSAHSQPPGFIEPNPTFFRRFSAFLANTRWKLNQSGAFTSTPATTAARLQTKAELARRLATMVESAGELWEIPEYQELHSYVSGPEPFEDLAAPDDFPRRIYHLLEDHQDSVVLKTGLQKFADHLERRAIEYLSGVATPPERSSPYHQLSTRWDRLQGMANRLEALLQKQLRGRPWNDEEAQFIKGYGPTLASCMGYFGNAYTPRDDAPRCVEVVRYAQEDLSFHAATGRARIFYVLYPWGGREIFCEGAVLPYYEFSSPERLTDADWKARLDSAAKPSMPEWIQPVMFGGQN